jgi:hypothetical protein
MGKTILHSAPGVPRKKLGPKLRQHRKGYLNLSNYFESMAHYLQRREKRLVATAVFGSSLTLTY